MAINSSPSSSFTSEESICPVPRNALVFVILLGLLLAVLFPVFVPGLGEEDFLDYWSASRLLATGGNPYDPIALRTLQYTTRPQLAAESGAVFAVWNPPWLLLIFLPLGFLPFDLAVPVWMFCNLLLIGIAIIISWDMLVESPDRRGLRIALLAGFLFGQTLIDYGIGQITGLILIGVVFSIKFLKSGRFGWAGLTLLLATIKPHLTYLILLLILVWSVRYGHWRVLGGMVIAVITMGVIMWAIVPGWILSYVRLIMSLPYPDIYTSTLDGFARFVFGFHGFRFAGLSIRATSCGRGPRLPGFHS